MAWVHRSLVLAAGAGLLGMAVIGGAGTAEIPPNKAYMQPVEDLTAAQNERFRAGENVFLTTWILFPQLRNPNWEYAASGVPMMERGLGPTFLANSCAACHVQAGRGRTTELKDSTPFQQLLRVSLPGTDEHGGPKPHPHYGNQLQVFDVIVKDKNHIRSGEADMYIDWQPVNVSLADGTTVELREPKVRVENLNFGPLGSDILTSLRNAPPVFGLGYFEAVSEKDILALAAAQKVQGLNGRVNYVRDDVHRTTAIGRFGWKANQPSVRQQIAAAFHGDMGITSSLYPAQNCPPVQQSCKAMIPGDKVELRDAMFDDITFWVTTLDAPEQRNAALPAVKRGEQLFAAAKCAACHVPELRTSEFPALPQLSNRSFRPYADMLIHDMGPGLADGRPDFQATGRDWRTAPLWGIGLSKQVNGSANLLHDGRARNVMEAILWHGGEAQAARDYFARLKKDERDDLLAFVNSL